jgi:hypothetical protein
MIEVLLAHRQLPADAVVAGIGAALGVGSDPAVVLIEANKHAHDASAAVIAYVIVPLRPAAYPRLLRRPSGPMTAKLTDTAAAAHQGCHVSFACRWCAPTPSPGEIASRSQQATWPFG